MSGYVFAAVFWFLAGAYFLAANLVPQNGDIRAFFSSFFPTIMFMVPILTMRLYAEERKMKTDELLLTSPAALSGIMFGKFLAALAVFVAIMSLTAIFPLILAAFGASPSGVSDPLAVIGCFTGMVLMTSSLVAVGLWISVHSENQIAAATVTCAVFLTLHLLNGAGAIVGDRTAAALLSSLSPTGRFIHFANGIFDPADVVFYVSVTALFLFLSARAPDRKRLSAAFERQSRVILALSLCLFVLVNVFAWLAGQRFDVRFDMTGERLYAPSPPAIESVRSLFASGSSSGSSFSVVISVISDEESFPPVLREMLRRLEKLSPRIDVRYVDPWENPAFVNHYRQLGHAPGASDILVEGPSGVRLLRYGDLFVYRDKTVNGIREVHGIQLEQMLMSAMKSVIKNGASPRAAFTVGHNERPSGALKNLFSSNGCLVENLYVGAGVGLDPNADIIVLAGPSRDFSREEADALRDWLSKGGKLAAFLGPDGGPYPNLGGLLRDWNMELADGLVLEEKAYAAGSPVNVIPQYAPHPVNLYFVENPSYAVMPRARAIKIVGKGPGAFTPEALLVSTSGSFARSG
ncbi:MAG: Gldg family protein, partial [Synergistaceae bacterium]|nr:Gldg family protein [Synergistaceae bacterium]